MSKLDGCNWLGAHCPWAGRCALLGCDRVERICADVLLEHFARVMPGHFEPIEDEL